MLEDENKKAKKDSSTDVIVIGVGSIGYRHLRYAANRYANVVAIDTDEAKLQLIHKEYGASVSAFSSLEDFFLRDGSSYSSATAVVSNLGPDHFSTVKALLEKGIQKILLEKPVSNSISTCQDLVALQRLSGASIVVGFRRRHSGIVEAVRRSANEHCGSPPTTVVVHGGGSGHVNERHSLARFCLRAI